LSKVLATGVGDGFQGYGLLADHIGSAWSSRSSCSTTTAHCCAATMDAKGQAFFIQYFLFCLCYEEITLC
jgi:hypothetical protein